MSQEKGKSNIQNEDNLAQTKSLNTEITPNSSVQMNIYQIDAVKIHPVFNLEKNEMLFRYISLFKWAMLLFTVISVIIVRYYIDLIYYSLSFRGNPLISVLFYLIVGFFLLMVIVTFIFYVIFSVKLFIEISNIAKKNIPFSENAKKFLIIGFVLEIIGLSTISAILCHIGTININKTYTLFLSEDQMVPYQNSLKINNSLFILSNYIKAFAQNSIFLYILFLILDFNIYGINHVSYIIEIIFFYTIPALCGIGLFFSLCYTIYWKLRRSSSEIRKQR